MSTLLALGRPLIRWLGGYYKTDYFYAESNGFRLGPKLAARIMDLAQVADFRPQDRVLDMGCAEGLITLEVAKQVARIHGVDFNSSRIERARKEAGNRNITNASFTDSAIVDFQLDPEGYDVVLFLGLMGKRTRDGLGTLDDLKRLLRVTGRQIIVRANIQNYEMKIMPLSDILAAMDECSFDAVCFSRCAGLGNLIVGNRRGTDARLRTVPPLVLVPTEYMRDHPCLHGAQIGSYADFA